MEKEDLCLRLGELGQHIWGGTKQAILSDEDICNTILVFDTGNSLPENRDFIILTSSHVIRLSYSSPNVTYFKIPRGQAPIKTEKKFLEVRNGMNTGWVMKYVVSEINVTYSSGIELHVTRPVEPRQEKVFEQFVQEIDV